MAYMKDATGTRLDGVKVISSPATRKSFLALGAPNLNNTAAFDFAYRTMARLPVATGRWRIGFANRNLRSATVLTTPVTITGVFVGDPVYATTAASGARWAGGASGALTSVSGALTVPTDGSTVWSSWITDTGKQFAPLAAKVIGWGHSNANTGTGVAYGDSVQYYRAAGHGSAANATLTTPTLTTQGLLDIVIEYETVSTAQIGLFIGDSNTIGFAPSPPPLFSLSGLGALPHEAWPNVAAELGGFVAVNAAVGSTTLNDYSVALPVLWSRMDLASVQFDFAVVSLGTNGLADQNLNLFVSDLLAINAKLRALGIKRIYWTDIPPRGDVARYSTLAVATTAGATTFQTLTALTLNAGTNGVVIGSDTAAEDVVVTGAPSGSGPYTYTLAASGTLANAHAAGESVAAERERARRRQNAWLRGLPDGIAGLISFEKAFEKSPESPLCDGRYVGADQLHFIRGAGAQRAAVAALAGVQPKLA